jgi:hypothetical protein
MRITTSTARIGAALAVASIGLLGVPAASAAGPAAPAAPVTGTAIRSLPFYGTGDVTGSGSGTAGTPASNDAVARACNAGEAIQHPQWYRLPQVSLGNVTARVDAPFHPRGVDQNPSGVAFVDVSSGNVLACGPRTVVVSRSRPVAVVAYYSQPVDFCSVDTFCVDGSLRLYVNKTTTAAPRNDHWQSATTISSLPFTGSVDSSVADDDGPAVFDYEHCEMSAIDPVQHGTVWWRYTPKTTGPVPTLAVDVRSHWNGLGSMDGFDGFSPRVAVAQLTPAGPVPAPRPDPWDCETPLTLQAGQTYLIAVFVFQDTFENSTPVTGGPLTLRVGEVARPRVPGGVGVTVAPETRQATLRWSPPAAAAGAGDVTGYTVRLERRTTGGAWQARSTTRLPATARELTVPGLTSSRAYRLRVAAVNGAGTGVSAFEVLSPR